MAWLALALVAALMAACAETGGGAGSGSASVAIPDTIAADLVPLAHARDAAKMHSLARERNYRVGDHGVFVEAQTRGLTGDDATLFERSGMRVAAFSPKYQRVGLIVATPGALRELGRLSVVRRIEPVVGHTSGG